jgi:hypothetical protein
MYAMILEGITHYVNLLEEADVGSLKVLRSSDPCELTGLLKQVNDVQNIVKQTPDLKSIQKWVQEAQKTDSRVR